MNNEIGRTREKALEDYLCNDINNLRQIDNQLIYIQRQLKINSCIIDIYALKFFDDKKIPVGIELKATADYSVPNVEHQLQKYYTELSEMSKMHESELLPPQIYFVAPIIAPSIYTSLTNNHPGAFKFFEVTNTGDEFTFKKYKPPNLADNVTSRLQDGLMSALRYRGTYSSAAHKLVKSLGLPKIADPILTTCFQVIGIAGNNMYREKKKGQRHI